MTLIKPKSNWINKLKEKHTHLTLKVYPNIERRYMN